MAPQTSSVPAALTLNTFTRTGYTFAGWSTTPTGAVVYADGATYNFSADITLYAQWTVNTYTLTVATAGTGSGNVTPGSGVYNHGTVVTVTATPATGSIFAGWSGACSGMGDCVVTMTTNLNVTATFAINTYTLTYTAGANGTISGDQPADGGPRRQRHAGHGGAERRLPLRELERRL